MKNMKYMFENSIGDNNEKLTLAFRQYLDTQKETFDVEIEAQRDETKREIELQRK